MNYWEVPEPMIYKHSLMPLALSMIGYNLMRKRACSQTPLMP
jgi:hypothetical protein